MTTSTPRRAPGFETAETFHDTTEFGQFVRATMPLLVTSFAFAGLVLGCVLGATGLGAFGWVLAFALAAGFSGILYRLRRRQFVETWSTSALRLSPWGAVSSDRHIRIELAWSLIFEIGRADTLTPLKVSLGNDIAELITGRAASVRPENALIGAGALTVSPDAPRHLRAQIEQNDESRDIHPASGQPSRAIALSSFDPDWRSGRIGEWIRAYRPDLLDRGHGLDRQNG